MTENTPDSDPDYPENWPTRRGLRTTAQRSAGNSGAGTDTSTFADRIFSADDGNFAGTLSSGDGFSGYRLDTGPGQDYPAAPPVPPLPPEPFFEPVPAGAADATAAGYDAPDLNPVQTPVPSFAALPVPDRAPAPAPAAVPAPAPAPAAEPARNAPEPAAEPAGTRAELRERAPARRRASFLDTQTARIPATRGFRGLLAGLGLRMSPSESELAERRDIRAVSQHWPGPRTISVVNGKGGANKTPTTVMLAAVFARNGGGPVLAWDNNETRGTLGWRTEQGPHDATVMDLLPNTGNLLSPSAQSALLARFVHHQTEDKFDVLRSKPDVLASEQKITMADFDALHEVASKYFRLNLVDSGNDESAERWLRMIHHTDQLVIATTTVEEHAEAGALLLEALQERGGAFAQLAAGAVVIVSQSDRNGTDAQIRSVAQGFEPLARATVTIPYDAALRKGQIRFGSLRPATQRAWLAAAAAVAEGLSEPVPAT
ncbi:MinD/ParA family ATP-binding protein [Arthrobacter sp. G119Y2]|uniref:MinD/ParA family ATP-binding protein n=1 Tax=Arthrobacter sp. G119Y2 TaxID=3134965 RepID=UPI003119F8A2